MSLSEGREARKKKEEGTEHGLSGKQGHETALPQSALGSEARIWAGNEHDRGWDFLGSHLSK